MNYVILGIAAVCIIVLVIWFTQFKTKEARAHYRALKEVSEKLEEQVEKEKESLRQLNEQQRSMTAKIVSLSQEYQIATQKAAEAKARADSQLAHGLEQTRAELEHLRKFEMQKLDSELQDKVRVCKEQYEFKKKQFEEDFDALNEYYQEELGLIKEELGEYAAKREAVNQAILRERKIEEKEDFYSIDVPLNDQEDIQILQSMDVRLHNRDVIPKLIWELFIKRPCQEMIKRITGGRKMSGIYKITYKKTGESYIGKTTDFSTRWQNHIKTAIGLEGAARTTLHNRLAKDGLWNYTFEILEEVDKEFLSTRESFYINLYNTKQQLNMKEGNK